MSLTSSSAMAQLDRMYDNVFKRRRANGAPLLHAAQAWCLGAYESL